VPSVENDATRWQALHAAKQLGPVHTSARARVGGDAGDGGARSGHESQCAWRNTGGCKGSGPREPTADLGCDELVRTPSGSLRFQHAPLGIPSAGRASGAAC
jgi:hypothetical protein